MEIVFLVNGKKDIFKSKAARKKLRDLLKKYSFTDLKTYWNKFKNKCNKYLNEDILFNTTFKKEGVIEITFIKYETVEKKNHELNRIKLRKMLNEKKKNRIYKGNLDIIEEELVEWRKDSTIDQNEVDLYIEARKQDPKSYVPDPIIIKKAPRMYIREFIEYSEELERTNPNSKLVYEYNAYVIYMRRLLDMEDDDNVKEIEI